MIIIDFVCNVFLWIISFLMYRMNETFQRRCKKLCLRTSSNTFYVDFVFVLLKVKILLYYILPSITRFIFQWENDYIDRVMPYEVSLVYFFELLALFVYYNTFYYLLKKNDDDLSFIDKSSNTVKVFGLVFLILFVYFTVNQVLSTGGLGNSSDDLWMIKPITVTVGSVLCFYILPMGKNKWNTPIWLFSLLVAVFYMSTAFTSGVRSTVFWPILWLFYCAYYFNSNKRRKKDNKKIIRWLVVGGVVLIILASVQGGMTSTRSSDITDIVGKLNEINSHKNDGSRPFLKEIDYRFGAPTHYSVGFIRMYNDGESAGLNPVLNSLYSPIPRRFMPDKPTPCSVDGDTYGTGMYKTYEKVRPGYANMSDFSTAAHAYWELGLLGIIIFSIIPAFYVFISIKLLRKFELLGPCFFLAILKPWGYNEPKIWVSEIVLQLSQIILVSCLLLFLFKKLKGVIR